VARRGQPGRHGRKPKALLGAVAAGAIVAIGAAANGHGGEAEATRSGVAAPASRAGTVEVPRLTGVPAGIAQGKLCRLGLPSVAQGIGPRAHVDAGAVLSTRPAAGTRVRAGRVVEVFAAGAPDGRYIVSGCR
jgi:PASTA domain